MFLLSGIDAITQSLSLVCKPVILREIPRSSLFAVLAMRVNKIRSQRPRDAPGHMHLSRASTYIPSTQTPILPKQSVVESTTRMSLHSSPPSPFPSTLGIVQYCTVPWWTLLRIHILVPACLELSFSRRLQRRSHFRHGERDVPPGLQTADGRTTTLRQLWMSNVYYAVL